MKKVLRVVSVMFFILLLAVTGLIVAINVSPKPVAWATNKLFSQGIGDPTLKPPAFAELSAKVNIQKDIEYPSRFEGNVLDLFSPKDASGPTPTILWVHGGGFVGGDKSDVETWATMIAGKGFTIVSINYALAPAQKYPGPIIQTAEAYDFVKKNPLRFPTTDLSRLIVGGDSAGAQIASQFAAIQTNPDLAKSMQMESVVADGELRGAILYCGPYDLRGLYDSEKFVGRFFARQMGWSYFGISDWRDSEQARQASTPDQVTAKYPATFLTDGNQASFETDARKLEAKLREKGVYVDSLYYSPDIVKLGHEYQFDFANKEAMEAFESTLAFLSRVTLR